MQKVSNKILNLEPDEKELVTLKYLSKPFGLMSLPDRTKWSKALLLKISVITGWVVPVNEMLNVLVDQFEKKLYESYANVNHDEVEFAFRSAGTTIEDWGKQINLSLIDQVMIPFLSRRFEVSKKEEQQKNKLELPTVKEDISDEGMDKFWEDTQVLVKKGFTIELIPPMLYDWMNKNGHILITKAEKREFFEGAVMHRHAILAKEYEQNPHSNESKERLTSFSRMRETRCYAEGEVKILQDTAKRMVVYKLMNT